MPELTDNQIADLRVLQHRCAALGAELVIIGAIAYQIHFPAESRHTGDIDFAVALDLDEFAELERRPDGSRLAAVIPPVVRPAPALTIRKFTSRHYTIDDLIARGTLTRPLADFLGEQIRCRKTLLISGGTGTGKTNPNAFLPHRPSSLPKQIKHSLIPICHHLSVLHNNL